MKTAKSSLIATAFLLLTVQLATAQCPTFGTTVVVTNTSSSALTPNSFAWAINCINNTTPLTTITFNIPAAGVNTINLTTALPGVTKPNALIDGTAIESVIVDGTSVGAAGPVSGLVLIGSGITVRGIEIRNFTNGGTGGYGIRMQGATNYNIADNRLYGNRIGIGTTTTTLNVNITGNTIGLDGSGLPDGNTEGGILFPTTVANINVSNNTIAHNGAGITIPTGSTVLVSENSMYCNAGQGIARTDGPAVPVITSASTQVIKGTATGGHLVEVFEYDPSGCGSTALCQGRTFLGAVTATATGNWTLNLTAANPVTPGNFVTATATQSGNNTSRFATCRIIVDCNSFSATINENPIDCHGDSNGSLTAVPAGGQGPVYFYSWSNGAIIPTINGLDPGTYSVVVTDAAGCTATASATLTDPPPMTLDFSKTDVSCFGAADGTAMALPGGGVPGYTYLWSNGMMTQSISSLAPGTYSVTVADINPCRIIGTVSISEPAALTLNMSATDETSFGGNDGTATATVGGGSPAYGYQWSNGGNTASISNLAPGTYSVTVTDLNGCTIEGSATVAAFDCGSFSATIDAVMPLCNGDLTGSATAIPQGGNGPYLYNWDNGATTQSINGLNNGTFSVSVTDADNCPAVASVLITPPPAILIQLSATDQTLFNVNNGTATVTANGGTGVLQYLWNNGGTTSTISNLAPGTYTVTVTDANACTRIGSVTVNALTCPGFLVTVNILDVSCNGAADGAATAIPSGSAGPFTYLWNTGAMTPGISNLVPGIYSVTVADALGCPETASGALTQPDPLTLSLSTTNETALGANDGTATATVGGGSPAYDYQWSNGGNTENISNLAPGTYSVTVTDLNGCTIEGSAIVAAFECGSFSASIDAVMPLCNGDLNGSATANPQGGNAPYFYLWNTGATTQSINGLNNGTFSVSVTDADNCPAIASVLITPPPAILIQLSATDQTLFNVNNGTATVIANGGTGVLQYLWNNGGTTSTISNLAPGTYTVTVTDANACTRIGSVTVNALTCPGFLVTVDMMDVSCNGAADGAATAIPSGSAGPFSYLWNTGDTTSGISNLIPGIYSVTVNDALGCPETASGSLAQPDPLILSLSTTDETSSGANDGTASAMTTGGTGAIQYSWSNGGNTESISNLAPGTYSVTATDENGCIRTGSGVVASFSCTGFTLSINNVISVNCNGETTGGATASVSGGGDPWNYTWSNGANTPVISNVGAGAYSVTAENAAGCMDIASTFINESPALILNCSEDMMVSQPGGSDGQGRIEIGGGSANYIISYNGPMSGQLNGVAPGVTLISGLVAGVYSVTITDNLGCMQTCGFTINAANCALNIDSIAVQNVSCFGLNDGTLAVFPVNAIGDLTFTWNNPALNGQQNPGNLAVGNYSVTITDSAGCSASGNASIDQPTALTLTIVASGESTQGANDGTATANAGGGIMPYTYLWSNGASTASINNLSPGEYSVTVSFTSPGAGNSCEISENVTITTGGTGGGSCRAQPAYALSVPDEVCQNAVFTLDADDLFPSPDVRYVWFLPTGDSVVTTQSFVNLTATSMAFSGEYFVLRDSLGCRSNPLGGAPMTVVGFPDGAVFAGLDTVICSASDAVLTALPLSSGTGAWRSLGAAKPGNPVQSTTTASNLQVGANQFVWEASMTGCLQVVADTITLFLEREPVLGDDNYQLQFTNSILLMEVLLNDNLTGLKDTLVYLLDGPEEGVLEYREATHRFSYQVDDGFRGVVTFRYVVCPPESDCQLPCDTATVRIEVLNMPSVSEGLILNETGRNGFMEMKGTKGFTRVEIFIVNRWGDLVYKSRDYAAEPRLWDGTMGGNGNALPQGAYYYQLRAYEGDKQVGETQTGVIHLFEQKF